MKLRPLGDRLVIKMLEVEEKTESGIVLPDSAKEKPNTAEVLALGSGITEDEIKVGDHIMFSKYAGNEVELDGEEYIIIKLKEVLAVVEQ